MTPPANKHGRKPGRGLRPWLLIPKVLCAGVLLGGLVSASVLLHAAEPADRAAWQALVETTSHLFTLVIVPAAMATILFGLLLLLQHPAVFLKRRWLQVKLAVLVLTVPALHFTARALLAGIRQELSASEVLTAAPVEFGAFRSTVDVAIVVVVAGIILGRHKPRLGQGATATSRRDAGAMRARVG